MFNTLQTAVTGMSAAQVSLSTTGHNIANIGTTGYSRQRAIYSDAFYRNVGLNGNGTINQIGTGVNVTSVQQVRDVFLDRAYRRESTKLDYFEIKTSVGQFVELSTGELGAVDGSLSIQQAINGLWDSMQEAVQYPESLDKRASLVSNAQLFIERMQTTWTDLSNYQQNLNEQVKDQVNQINHLTTDIKRLNELILQCESNGDNANDYRDSLNVAIEDLNKIIPVDVEVRKNGKVDLFVNGLPLLSNGLINKVGLKYTDADSGFVEPVFTGRTDIIGYHEEGGIPLFSLTENTPKSQSGSLSALLVTRGIRSETYASTPVAPDSTDATKYPLGVKDPQYKKDYQQYKRDLFNVQECTIPKAMKRLDQIFNRVVSVINDAIAPKDHDEATAPVGIDSAHTQFFEMFSRINTDRYDATGTYNEEDKLTVAGEYPNRNTLYSIANCQINPALLELDGYKKLPLSANGDLGNPDAVVEALDAWYDAAIYFDDSTAAYNVSEGYNHVVSVMATEVQGDATSYDAQFTLVTQIDNYRQATMGVSSDEEMSNMLQFQRSYQASARVINIVDSMIETIINTI